jgi:hypothetical protein
MLTELAVMAPVSSAVPNAVAQSPTAIAAEVAETLFVNVVDDVKATVDVLVVVLRCGVAPGFVVVLVLELFDLVGMTGTVPLTTKLDPEIEVTLPKAVRKVPARPPAVPPGNVPRVDDPRGKVPLGNPPEGRNPPNPPALAPAPAPAPAPNPPTPVHEPVELGWVSDTVVAVKWVEDDFEVFDELVRVALTQSPTASCAEGNVNVWVNFVDAVQVTVT